jgi:hypothetical protein
MRAEGAHDADWSTRQRSGRSRRHEGFNMPMKLLAKLANMSLPHEFDDLEDVEKIRVLKAHEHVEANIPPWRFGFARQPATVHAVTDHGRRALGHAYIDHSPYYSLFSRWVSNNNRTADNTSYRHATHI